MNRKNVVKTICGALLFLLVLLNFFIKDILHSLFTNYTAD